MSYITLATQGLAAVEAHEWDEGITKLSKALSSSANPAWLLARSKALTSQKRYSEALQDAEFAFHKAYERNSRHMMIDAHYRRAVAYFRMGQLANADFCCILAMRVAKGFPASEKEDVKSQYVDADGFWTPTVADVIEEAKSDQYNSSKGGGLDTSNGTNSEGKFPHAVAWRRASTLRMQTLGLMAKLPADDEARKPTAQQKPEERELSDVKRGDKTSKDEKSTTTAAVPTPPADTPLRVQDFQSNTSISVSIFSKGVNKDKLQVEFMPSAVRLNPVIYPAGHEGEYRLDLWGGIDTSASKFSVTPNKIELTLVKKEARKWPQLKRDESAVEASTKSQEPKQTTQEPRTAADNASAEKDNSAAEPVKTEAAENPAAPSYPSSSRTGPKNWEQIGAELDEDDSSDVNAFFKNLYKNATPEQQRAMMKSFTESSGTSLSTDWSDVKDRTVETVPPEGVEAKKWQE